MLFDETVVSAQPLEQEVMHVVHDVLLLDQHNDHVRMHLAHVLAVQPAKVLGIIFREVMKIFVLFLLEDVKKLDET